MKDIVLSLRVNSDELKQAKKWCDENATSIQLQINKLIRELSNKKEMINNGK